VRRDHACVIDNSLHGVPCVFHRAIDTLSAVDDGARQACCGTQQERRNASAMKRRQEIIDAIERIPETEFGSPQDVMNGYGEIE